MSDEKINAYQFGRDATPKEMAEALSGYFNSFDHSKGQQLAEEIDIVFHRTVLQTFAGFVIHAIRMLATCYADGRNESSQRAMAKLSYTIDQEEISDRFPMI
jgi:hypothetical protein